MAVTSSQVGKVMFTGIFKVLNQASPKWQTIREQAITDLFDGTANPTGWKDFFLEAVGTAIQQELIMRGVYCDDFEDTLKEYKDSGKTWANLEDFVKEHKRNISNPWT